MTHDEAASLREILRRETREEHDRLDAMMSAMPLGSDADYARFLIVQYRARYAVEGWLAMHCPSGDSPPPQCPALAADLMELETDIPTDIAEFAAPSGSELGISWVLAGSSLGNRSLLKQRIRAGLDGPHRFLSSEDMPAFFKQMLAKINAAPFTGTRALNVAGAKSVFDRFLQEASEALAGKVE